MSILVSISYILYGSGMEFWNIVVCFFLWLFDGGQINAAKDWQELCYVWTMLSENVRISLRKSNYLSALTGFTSKIPTLLLNIPKVRLTSSKKRKIFISCDYFDLKRWWNSDNWWGNRDCRLKRTVKSDRSILQI